MDMEWARDGEDGLLYIVQARPETVQSRADAGAMKSYTLGDRGALLLSGLSVGGAVATGEVCIIESAADIDRFIDGSVLVTSTTDPDWVPIMKRAAAIVTDHGGRTSHAAIVSRELGVPAIVGTGNATTILHDHQMVTVSCAEGEEGRIYAGAAEVTIEELRPRQRAEDEDQGHAQPRQPLCRDAVVASSGRWRGAGADGVRGQQRGQGASPGADPL